MNIVIFSSVFNHHSLPLCDALNRLPNVECIFVETMEEETQRRELGYHSYDRNYVLNMLASDENQEKAYELAMNADVMIAGVFPYAFLKERLQRGKLTFLCQERIFKGKVTLQRKIRVWLYNMRKFFCFRHKPLYFLSIGKKAAQDYRSIGFYRNKCFQWAYYPPYIPYDVELLMDRKVGDPVRLLFVGRLISLKHPEFVLFATKTLLQKGYSVCLTYIGNGDMEETLRSEAEEICQSVSFLGSMPPEQVREHMESANIFTFNSNAMEGWGAVVNEAMNAGCALVASNAAGAVTTLVEDGENGLIYEAEDYEQFYQKLEMLVANKELTQALGKAAYKTISEQYNADIAAKRFCEQCELLLDKKPARDYDEGIMKKLF